MSTRTITAIFDSSASAQVAQERLLSLGLPQSDVRVVNQSDDARQGDSGKGMWESIKDFFVPDEDRVMYSEGLRRGGYLLTARVDDAYVDRACEILESSDAIDLEQRAEQWRTQGWSAAGATTAGGYGAALGASERETEDAIPVVREELRVGKREVDRGGVRVRSYIVEEPIEAQVNLREEHVDVERRPVRQRAAAGDAENLLRDRTIEVNETAEEPVVSKEASVDEEVVVRKFTGERTEGVSDTVRHTEVDVEDTRGDRAPPPSERQRRKDSRSSKPAR